MKMPNLDQPSVGKFLNIPMRELAVDAALEHQDPRAAVRMEGEVVLRPGLQGADGSLWAGAAIAILDNVGGFTAGLAALPDGWVVTTNLRYRRLCAVRSEKQFSTARVERRGANAVVTHIEFTDEHGACAEGILTSAVLSPEGGPPVWDRPVVMEREPLSGEEAELSFWDWIEATVEESDGTHLAAHVELEPRHRNPWGIVHGGVGPAVAVGLVEQAIAAVPRTVVRAELHYLAPVRSGPLRVVATELYEDRSSASHLYEIQILDGGSDDRLCITGTMLAVPAVSTEREGELDGA